MSDGSQREVYVHGYSALEQQLLQARRATESAAFFFPFLRPGMRLLDCGCGPGSITLGLADVVAPGQVIGVDLELRQVEAARQLAAERRVANVRFDVGSVYELPLPDAAFDAAFANTLLLHLREPLRALREIRRVLRPGGVVGIADGDFANWLMEPTSPSLERVRALYVQAIRHNGGDPYLARHYRRLLLEAGFLRSEAWGRISADTHGTTEGTRRLAASVVELLQSGMLGRLSRENGWATEEDLAAMIAEVREWGERPDAFHAIFGCAAVGWVGDVG
jgi:ubiquinone/menaquinone biosynthesis C-methylase UbiE